MLNKRRHLTDRTSHWRCSMKKGFLQNFEKFTRKQMCWSLFSWPITLFKNRPRHPCFPVNFENLLGIPFFQDISGWLLLDGMKLKEDNLKVH